MGKQVSRKGEGMDFFRMEVNFWDNDKIRMLARTYKECAISRYVVLASRIYEQGYYLKWDAISASSYCERHGYEEGDFNKFILACIDANLFDKTVFYKYGVLTSKRIQESYLEMYDRRTQLAFRYFYCVLPTKRYSAGGKTITFIDEEDEDMIHDSLPKKDKCTNPEDEYIKTIVCCTCVPTDRQRMFEEAVEAIGKINLPPQNLPPTPIQTPASENSEEYIYSDAKKFADQDFNEMNDLLKKQVESKAWLSSYKTVIDWIGGEFNNLKISKFQLTYAEYRKIYSKWRFDADVIYKTLTKISLSGTVKENTKMLHKIDQYMDYIVNPDIKEPSQEKNKSPNNGIQKIEPNLRQREFDRIAAEELAKSKKDDNI